MIKTKQELIDLIKEKQENANIEFDKVELDGKPSTIATMYNLIGNIRAYEDIIALLKSTEIVNEPICENSANSGDKAFKITIINLLNQILRAIKNK